MADASRSTVALASICAIAALSLISSEYPTPAGFVRLGLVAAGMCVVRVGLTRRHSGAPAGDGVIYGWLATAGLVFVVFGFGLSPSVNPSLLRDIATCVLLVLLCLATQGIGLYDAVKGVRAGQQWLRGLLMSSGFWALVVATVLLTALSAEAAELTHGEAWLRDLLGVAMVLLPVLAVSPWEVREPVGPRNPNWAASQRLRQTLVLFLSLLLVGLFLYSTARLCHGWYWEWQCSEALQRGDHRLFRDAWAHLRKLDEPAASWGHLLPSLQYRSFTAAVEPGLSVAEYTYSRGPTGRLSQGGRHWSSDPNRGLLTDGRYRKRVVDASSTGELAIIFDLGVVSVVDLVKLWTYRDGGGGTRSISVEVSVDGTRWRRFDSGSVRTAPYRAATSFQASGEPARFVRISLSGSGEVYTNLVSEVSIEGYVVRPGYCQFGFCGG